MGNRNSRRFGKFYWEQVTEIIKLLERSVKESTSDVSIETYLLLCEQLEQEPDPDKMPLDASVFPPEVQVAFFIFDLLPDRWEGMSGMYLGKDWSSAEFLFKIYEIEDIQYVTYFAKIYESILVSEKAEEANKKRKASERKAKAKR
jgi:hypothetical protein